MNSLPLPFDAEPSFVPSPDETRDQDARARAVDPRFNVALEASAGTGKTRVLVDRYVNLLRAGVAPANILAMTFTRKAATEMGERILLALRTAAERGEIAPARWRELQARIGDIQISTIDAFCLSLLREFPLEADLDPGFSVADDSEVPRLVGESLDRALRVCRGLARTDERVALVFAQLGERRVGTGLAALLSRRIVAPALLQRFLARSRRDLTVDGAAGRARAALLQVFGDMAPAAGADEGDGLRAFVMSGPADAAFMLFVRQLEALETGWRAGQPPDARLVHAAFTRARDYFLTRTGQPRRRLVQPRAAFPSDRHWKMHRELVARAAPAIVAAERAYRHDLNVLVAGGVWRMFRVAEDEYRRTLDAHAMLDFSDLLLRTLEMLRRMEEFARSRYRLESRYHHVLVDEFQDTSRAQWELVSLLVQSWGEGAGLAHANPLPPSIFIVGDRKQSIYGFRDADVSVLGDAIAFLQGLRPEGHVRRSISRSFRSVPALLSFVNDVCLAMDKTTRSDAFAYGEDDRFPIDPAAFGPGAVEAGDSPIGLITGTTTRDCAETVAGEIARLLRSQATIRDVTTGVRRAVRAGDVAILFRTRESHREYEAALEQRAIPSFVYKGLGFFDSSEVRDVLAVLGFLAEPVSNLRAAALLRSGFARVSDETLRRLSPGLAAALVSLDEPPDAGGIDESDAATLRAVRAALRGWLTLVDRLPPAELLDRVVSDSAYAMELRGPRRRQARENLKKVRGLVRRAQNAGYATLERVVSRLDRLAVGDESNATIDAGNAVHLMTVHASKGLEFPVVFLTDLSRGTARRRPPIRVAAEGEDEVSVSVGDFQTASDEDEAAQQREETKRLLYVGLTRARDRLYLGSTCTDGQVQPGRGSLAEVIPLSLLGQVPAVGPLATWVTGTGEPHALRIVPRPSADEPLPAVAVPSGGVSTVPHQDFGPLQHPSRRRSTISAELEAHELARQASARLLGSVVHRLVSRVGLDAAHLDSVSRSLLVELVRSDERDLVDDWDSFAETAIDCYRRIVTRDEVCALYRRGVALHEVPFTMLDGGTWIRGTVDCLVLTPGPAGSDRSPEQVTVLELKTGRPESFHPEQAAAYRRAACTMFPAATVDAVIIYPDAVVRLG